MLRNDVVLVDCTIDIGRNLLLIVVIINDYGYAMWFAI
jgi:hypothetical protein